MDFASRHQCFIYDGSSLRQLPMLAEMIQQKLVEGFVCLYLNSKPMVASMRLTLSGLGINVAREVASGKLILSSDSIPGDGTLDIEYLLGQLETMQLQAVGDGHRGMFATGDMTWEFGSEKNFMKLMEYEYRLEKLFRKHTTLCGICQYHKDTLPLDVPRKALLTHQSIFVNETLSQANPYYIPPEGSLIQKATNLELDEMIVAVCKMQSEKTSAYSDNI